MTDRLQYGTTAKVFHWLIVALLLVQYPIGWLMPDLHRDMKPGVAMTFHVSIGLVILTTIVLRFAWRLTHPVAPESSLPRWQRLISEAVHWLLYALVLATAFHRLAVRVVPRLVDVVVLSRADADAGIRQRGGRQDDRRPASGHGMDLAGGDRPPCGGGDGPPHRLPRPHHAADVACDPAAIGFQLSQASLSGRGRALTRWLEARLREPRV